MHDQGVTCRIEMDGTLAIGVTPNDPSIWTCCCTSQHPDQDALLTRAASAVVCLVIPKRRKTNVRFSQMFDFDFSVKRLDFEETAPVS